MSTIDWTIDNPSLLVEALTANGKWLADKPVLICGDRQLSYAEFDARSNQVATLLVEEGCRPGDAIALLCKNRIAHFEVMYGALKAGCVIVPLSTMLNAETLKSLLVDCGARYLFTEGDAVRSLQSDALTVIDLDGDYAARLDQVEPNRPGVSLTATYNCSVIYSSGTTGTPKGIVHSHFARGMYGIGFAAEYSINSNSRTLLATPAYSNGSWMMILPTLYMGGTLIIQDGFSPQAVIDALSTARISHTFLVPTQIESLLNSDLLDEGGLPSLEALVSAGSTLRPATIERVLSHLTKNLFNLYGNTEGVSTILRPWQISGNASTVGLPICGGNIRILSDDETVLPADERGEIVGSSPFMSKGYHNLPDINAGLFWRDESGHCYVKTGDVGYLDERGYLTVVDRKKDMIVSGGINVFASDLEAVIASHPDVRDVAVIGIPHDKWGETPLALVLCHDRYTVSEAELRSWCNERLNKHQRLHAVEFRKSLPRNALGKIVKRELRAAYWAG